jgi:hypothetical protein
MKETAMPNQKRPGLRDGAMTEFTVFATVKPGQEKAIREAIKQSTMNPLGREANDQMGTFHEAKFVLFDNDTHKEQ